MLSKLVIEFMMKNSLFVLNKPLLGYADLVIAHMNTFERAHSKLKSHFISKISIISVNFEINSIKCAL